MSYTSLLGRNPMKLPSIFGNIEIRAGSATTAEEIADIYEDTLLYEPPVGSIYFCDSGSLYIHDRSGIDANDWSYVSEIRQSDSEIYTITAIASAVFNFYLKKSFGVSVTASVGKTVGFIKSTTATAAASLAKIYVSGRQVAVSVITGQKLNKKINKNAGVSTSISVDIDAAIDL